MKTRPRTLVYLAYTLLLIAISLPCQIMIRYGDMPWELAGIFSKLAPLNWVILSLAIFEAYLLWDASPWVWAVAPSFLVAVIWNNWLVATLGTPMLSIIACIASAVTVGIHAVMLQEQTRKVLTQPGLRWWKTPQRRRVTANATIYPTDGGELVSHVVDISESGVFLATPEKPEKRSTLPPKGLAAKLRMNKTLKVGTYCSIRLKLAKGLSYSCTARVVRQNESNGPYPAGFGLCFVSLTSQERRNLEGFIKAA